MKPRLQFKFNGKWISLPKAAEIIGVGPTTLRWWVKAGNLNEKLFEHLGYVPKTRWYHSSMKGTEAKSIILQGFRKRKPRWFMVYVTNDPDVHGVGVGYGKDEGEAIANFLKSRRLSGLDYQIKYISTNERHCQAVIGQIVNRERLIV